jgi:L-erythro-3,5-diaminohexanoate dehydrogenase
MRRGNLYGTHRVIEPQGILPQPATKIDNNMEIYDNEILIDVQTLNIDSASFTQIHDQAAGNVEKIKEIMKGIVLERGKHQNPVTGSGGMLIGTVEKIGSALVGKTDLKVGDKIATLVSLSLTPLRIDEIVVVREDIDQVDIKGKAILFESGIYAKLPTDIPENLALSVLDVAGAPAQTAKLVKEGDTVLIIGGAGKSGILCLYEAKKIVGPKGKVICFDYSRETLEVVKELGVADVYMQGDATNAVDVYNQVMEATDGKLCDLVISNVSRPNCELGAILSTKDSGVVYFFSMATSFTQAALGAEGVGKDITMLIGNGYTRGHSEVALQIIRESKILRDFYTKMYA